MIKKIRAELRGEVIGQLGDSDDEDYDDDDMGHREITSFRQAICARKQEE